MDNAFYIDDMTSLRYAMPFIKTSKRLLNKDVVLIYDQHKKNKYNSFSNNINRLLEIIKDNDIISLDITNDSQIIVENLFCVENTIVKKISFQRIYSIQHGFDYTVLANSIKNVTYLVTEEFFQKALKSQDIDAIIQPIPVSFWDWDYYCKYLQKNFQSFLNEHTAVLFYPENGIQDIFQNVFDVIKTAGYHTCVKQRRKAQPIPGHYNRIFYDDIWYPTESILLPMLGDLCIGLGTSAYTDVVHLKRQFIDMSIPSYSKNYYKPLQKEKFININEDYFNGFLNVNLEKLSLQEKITNPCNDENIKIFLNEILS